jgi:S-disulfanyl-L-cysteine oxidoreductase SoxD
MKIPSFGYRGRVLGTVAGLLASSAFAAPRPSLSDALSRLASTERSVWSGVYTQTQAERGRATFEASCAACHRPDLSGRGPIPALRGDAFTGERHGRSVGDLYEVIRSTMPPGRPASLTPEAYADVVAYLLSANAFPPGESDLPSHEESLQGIVFDQKVE